MDIPVYLVGAAGTPDADNPECSPCIICTLIHPLNQKETQPALAMLDSGAFPNAIDLGFWKGINLPIIGTDTLHSVAAVEHAAICTATILVRHSGGIMSIPANFSISPMRNQGMPYDLILGRQFLTKFDFGFRHSDQKWHLSAPDSATSLSLVEVQ